MVVQVNGKVRDRIDVDPAITEADAEAAAGLGLRTQVVDALAVAGHGGHRRSHRSAAPTARGSESTIGQDG